MANHPVRPSDVSAVEALDPPQARAHFERLLRLETDCWDVHEALVSEAPDFVLPQTSASP